MSLTMSQITDLMMDHILGNPESAAQSILAAIDGGEGKRGVKKLIAEAEKRGVDVAAAISTEIKRQNSYFDAFRSKQSFAVSGKPFRIPFHRPTA